MRVALVTETWLPSVNGVVTRLVATVGELRRRGHDVLVVAPAGCDDPFPGARVYGVPSVGIPFIYGGQPWGLPLPRVAKLLAGFRPDVVHAVNPVLLGWAGVVFARMRGVPLVCSYHTRVARYTHFYRMGFAERPVQALIREAHRHADVNLAASAAAKSELDALDVGEVLIWPGAVDLDRFRADQASAEMRARLSGGHPERRVLLWVGRLAAEKGLHRLVPLASAERGWHVALVGAGPGRAELERRFPADTATFVGELAGDELAAAYASADVLVFPSTTDTLGLVLLEALASGVPLLAARSPSSTELAAALPATTLFEPDDAGGLVAAAERVLDTLPDRRWLAAAARRVIPTWRRSSDVLLTAYSRAGSSLAERRAG